MKFITRRPTRARWALLALLVAYIMSLTTASVALADSAAGSPACSQQSLSFGSSGPCVKELQGALVGNGISVGPYGDDGQFGQDTRDGVLRYQRAYGLLVDGVVGPQTWEHLLTGRTVQPGGSTAPIAAPPPQAAPTPPTTVGKSMVAVESAKHYYAFEDGRLVRSFPARFGGKYWDPVKEEVGRGSTPTGLFYIGIMQSDMVSNLFEVEMPHSMCFAGGALYCVHGSDAFDQFGHTHPYVDGEAGSAGCINLHTWDAEWLFDWAGPGVPLLVQTDL